LTASTIAVKVVRVDKDTLRLLKYPLHVARATFTIKDNGTRRAQMQRKSYSLTKNCIKKGGPN